MSEQAFIVAAMRTPIGRHGDGPADRHLADLLGGLLVTLVANTGIDPSAVDDVIVGCVS